MKRIALSLGFLMTVLAIYQFIPAQDTVSTITVDLTKQWPTVSANGLLSVPVQAEVDLYKAERTLYNHQKFDDLVTAIGAGLSL